MTTISKHWANRITRCMDDGEFRGFRFFDFLLGIVTGIPQHLCSQLNFFLGLEVLPSALKPQVLRMWP